MVTDFFKHSKNVLSNFWVGIGQNSRFGEQIYRLLHYARILSLSPDCLQRCTQLKSTRALPNSSTLSLPGPRPDVSSPRGPEARGLSGSSASNAGLHAWCLTLLMRFTVFPKSLEALHWSYSFTTYSVKVYSVTVSTIVATALRGCPCGWPPTSIYQRNILVGWNVFLKNNPLYHLS